MDFLTAVLIVLALAAAGGIAFWYFRSPPKEGEAFLRFNCPYCNRKLKYKARKRGKPGACPGCKKAFIFPLNPGENAYLEDDAE